MTATVVSHASPDLSPKRSGRTVGNTIATVLMAACVVIVVVPLGFVLFTVVQKGASAISTEWFTEDIPPVRRSGPGMGPAIIGTLVITGLASLMAVPLGILGAVYLHEYGKKGRLASVLRFFADVMTGVPSIVMGLFIFTIWVLRFGVDGVTGLAGALALACLMLPIIIRSTEEMLRLVPDHLREASMALGASRSRTILTVVLPTALPGILSGVLLAIARAAGETAPLVVTIAVVNRPNANLFSGANTALAPQIFQGALDPNPGVQQRAWAAALTLILLVFIFTVIARWISSRFALRHS
jgi:phosphate transport system permease protein